MSQIPRLSQTQLIEFARAKHETDPVIRMCLLGVVESRARVAEHRYALQPRMELLEGFGTGAPHQHLHVGLNNVDLVTHAAAMASALDTYARALLDIATRLQELGEKFEY